MAAALDRAIPDPAASLEARVLRPDGSIEVLRPADDGAGPDDAAGDGLFSVLIAAGGQSGIHQVEVSAEGVIAGGIPYRRELTARFQVRSDAAKLGEAFASGVDDAGGDGLFEALWVDGSLEAFAPGIYVVLGTLVSSEGAEVAGGGILLSLPEAGITGYRLTFSGDALRASETNGPYLLARVVALDGSASMVPADEVFPSYWTAAYDWSAFGAIAPPARLEMRADGNSDGRIDIADGVGILDYLFGGSETVTCLDAADANLDGAVGLSDAVYILQYLFTGGPPPAPPFPGCESPGALGCAQPACAAP